LSTAASHRMGSSARGTAYLHASDDGRRARQASKVRSPQLNASADDANRILRADRRLGLRGRNHRGPRRMRQDLDGMGPIGLLAHHRSLRCGAAATRGRYGARLVGNVPSFRRARGFRAPERRAKHFERFEVRSWRAAALCLLRPPRARRRCPRSRRGLCDRDSRVGGRGNWANGPKMADGFDSGSNV
jgi:hypothetical protein